MDAFNIKKFIDKCDPDFLAKWCESIGHPRDIEQLEKRLYWENNEGFEQIRSWEETESKKILAAKKSLTWFVELIKKTECDKSDDHKDYDQIPFIELWKPLESWAGNIITQVCKLIPSEICVSENAKNALIRGLYIQLSDLTEQVLMKKFNELRNTNEIMVEIMNCQHSEDAKHQIPKDQYISFIRDTKTNFENILQQYPVLYLHINTIVNRWETTTRKLLMRISKDENELRKNFNIVSDKILDVHYSGSDFHNGGEQVLIIHFKSILADNELIKVVYKPRSVGLEIFFYQILKAIGSLQTESVSFFPVLLDRETHGYSEFVEHRLCTTEKETRNFYINSGKILATLHITGGSDCHQENLIACFDKLLLIDGETLMEPHLRHIYREKENKIDAVGEVYSVTRTGMLPSQIYSIKLKRFIDISCLGSPTCEEDEELFAKQRWLFTNTNYMMKVDLTDERTCNSCLPAKSQNKCIEYVKYIREGFEKQMKLINANKDLVKGLATTYCKNNKRRFIQRNTQVYKKLLINLKSPRSLETVNQQFLAIERLVRAYMQSENTPYNWQICKQEVEQLRKLDIPYFTHELAKCCSPKGLNHDLKISTEEFFVDSSLASFTRRLDTLSEREIKRQIMFINGTFVAKSLNSRFEKPYSFITYKKNPRTNFKQSHSINQYSIASVKSHAKLNSQSQYYWLCVQLERDGHTHQYAPSDYSFRNGILGLIFYTSIKKSLYEKSLNSWEIQLFRQNQISWTRVLSCKNLIYPWLREQGVGLLGASSDLLALHYSGFNDPWQSIFRLGNLKEIIYGLPLSLEDGSLALLSTLLYRQKVFNCNNVSLDQQINHLLFQQLKQFINNTNELSHDFWSGQGALTIISRHLSFSKKNIIYKKLANESCERFFANLGKLECLEKIVSDCMILCLMSLWKGQREEISFKLNSVELLLHRHIQEFEKVGLTTYQQTKLYSTLIALHLTSPTSDYKKINARQQSILKLLEIDQNNQSSISSQIGISHTQLQNIQIGPGFWGGVTAKIMMRRGSVHSDKALLTIMTAGLCGLGDF